MKKETIKKIFMAGIALTGWFALALQLYIMLRNGPSLGIRPVASIVNFLSFFTILTNLLVATSLTTALLAPGSRPGNFFSNPITQSGIALYILLVGIVYSIALRHIWAPSGLQLVADRFLHDAIPILYLFFWLIFIPRRVLTWNDVFPWMIYPAIYLVYSLVRGAMTGWYPYPFIHAEELGYGKVALNAFVVLLGILGIGFILIAFNRMAGKR